MLRSHWRPAVSSVTLLLLGGPANAQIPLGPEFRVNSGPAVVYSNGLACDAAMASDGRFVVAWTRNYSTTASDEQLSRRYDPSGRPAPQFRVNSYTTGRQNDGAVAMDDQGNFVVVWTSEDQDGSATGVFGQRFAASGERVGAEFLVNETTLADQLAPTVAMRRDGGYVVVWSGSGLSARLFEASGAPVTGDFPVNSTILSSGFPSADFDDAGNFVVVWSTASPFSVRGRLFSASGLPIGGDFLVNTGASSANRPRVGKSADGSFIVAWYESSAADPSIGITARRFDAAGTPLGTEFLVNSNTTGPQREQALHVDADGDLVVVWENDNGTSIFARRFDSSGAPTSPEFRVDAATATMNALPAVAGDRAGNFVVTWHSSQGAVLARRYAGGLMGAGLAVDATAGPTSDGNRVVEAGETVVVAPSWLNANAGAQTFTGTVSMFTGPGTSGNPTYSIADATAVYGTVVANATGSCAAALDCYAMGISVPLARPAAHWDATFREDIGPASLGAQKEWTLHVGESFTDVPRSNGFYRFVETLLHHGVTSGCGAATYCPDSWTTRDQMAVFVLMAKEGTGYAPPACGSPRFSDVPASSPFCPWIEELARRGVVGGCSGTTYCPAAAVSREQMAVFALRTLDPALSPPACGTAMFTDVPASSPFCPWIEELARRGVVAGCGGGAYCPASPVSREQMGVFLSVTFGLSLYGA